MSKHNVTTDPNNSNEACGSDNGSLVEIDDTVVENGKNKMVLSCLHCPSKIMEKQTATYYREDKNLPKMNQKKDNVNLEVDLITEWFVVDEIMDFENIGVSHAVDQTKFLTCADCEMGPVGWTDLSNKKCFVALTRVRQS